MKDIGLSLNAATDGAQMTPAAARAVDPVLSTAARGYRNADHVHHLLFPRVGTAVRGGTRIEFDRTDWRLVDTRRAPGSDIAEVQFGHAGKEFAVQTHGLLGKLPVEPGQDAMAVPHIDLGMRTVDGVQSLLSLRREWLAAQTATATANYDAGHRLALARNTQWSHADSKPTANIRAAVNKIRRAIGRRPKTVVMGGTVFEALQTHADILKGVFGDGAQGQVTAEHLARLWNMDTVAVGDAVYMQDDGDIADIWGSSVIVAYTAVGPVTRGEPSWGLGYELDGGVLVETPWYDPKCRSWMYGVHAEYADLIVGKDAGFLISDAAA